MSTKRSLTDELQSVMLEHSFDAPEPTSSIENILAKTVATTSPAVTGRRRWFPSPTLIGAAAVVAALIGGAALLNANRQTESKSSAGSASGVADSNRSQESNGLPPQLGLGKADAPSAAQAAPGAPARDGMTNCPGPRWTTTASSTFDIPANSSHGALTVRESYCADAIGGRSGSLVTVVASNRESTKPVTTLIGEQQQLHVAQINADSTGVTVRAGDPSGVVTDQRFNTANGKVFAAEPAVQVAGPCTEAELAVGLQPAVRVGAGSSRLIVFHNKSAQRCAIEGFPGVAATVGGSGAAITAGTSLQQPDGTTLRGAPSIVIVEPNESASALITFSDKPAANVLTPCTTALSITISLRGTSLAILPFATGICDLQIHPVQQGTSG
jgi:hypothetical protein